MKIESLFAAFRIVDTKSHVAAGHQFQIPRKRVTSSATNWFYECRLSDVRNHSGGKYATTNMPK